MNLNFKLNLEQTQKLIITQQLKQSLSILNMSLNELEIEVAKEGQENPVMEVEKKEPVDWEKYMESMKVNSKKEQYLSGYESSDEKTNFENMVRYEESMYEHLKAQISCILSKQCDNSIAQHIIDSMDGDGYLREDIGEISKRLGISTQKAKDILEVVQTLDPPGVGATSLEECLCIQLKEQGIHDEVLESVIRENLSLIAQKRYKDICKKYKIDMEKVHEYCSKIKSLEPRPGRMFESGNEKYVAPDVIVEDIDGEFFVRLNETSIPHITISDFYQNLLKNTQDEEAKEYIKHKLNSAANLIKNIESRKSTILKVSQEILRRQIDFFEKGTNHLKPMILKDIAQELEFHESTISRAVNGKYMLTPYGLFELKFFFSGSPSCEDVAANSIKSIIKDIIDEENKKKPYSDQKICEILDRKGISVSRRTVAKYRDEMGVLSSSQRKEL